MNGKERDLTLKAVTELLCLRLSLLKRQHDVAKHSEHLVHGRLLTLSLVIKEGEGEEILRAEKNGVKSNGIEAENPRSERNPEAL